MRARGATVVGGELRRVNEARTAAERAVASAWADVVARLPEPGRKCEALVEAVKAHASARASLALARSAQMRAARGRS